MKNISVALNAVLLIAVAFLYYLHFKKPAQEQTSSASVSVPTGSKIVYVSSDSLLDQYIFFKEKKLEFEKKNQDIKKELSTESERLKRDAESYQQKGGTMTSEQRAKTEEQLMERQQNLMKRKDDLMGDLENEQAKFHEQLYSKINEFLREYNKGKNYHFVLGYTGGGGILFANDSLDVTKQVINGLNTAYQEKK